MAGRRVDVAMTVGTVTTTCALDLSDLTAALWSTARDTSHAPAELLTAPSADLGALVLRSALGIGGVELEQIAEAFALYAWSGEVTEAELALWNQCAALVEAMFGPAARLPKERTGGGERA